MNKKQKIIVSITGIIIIVLALLGLTYAYFVTNIDGNGNDKSIEVTTANLHLTYEDGNGTITGSNIMPGTTLDPKTFTVENDGTATVSSYAVYLENVINTMINTSDVVYTLTCTSTVTNKGCNGIEQTTFPTYNDILITNSIDAGEIQTYSLTVTYLETNENQSDDMGKTFSGQIQIYDMRSIVDITGSVTGANEGDYVELQSTPKVSQINNENIYKITAVTPGTHTLYLKDKNDNIIASKQITINMSTSENISSNIVNITDTSQTIVTDIAIANSELTLDIKKVNGYNPYDEGTLAYNIINNAQENKNGTTFRPIPLTTPGKEEPIQKYSPVGLVDLEQLTLQLSPTVQENFFTYGTGYKIDEKTGLFSLTGVSVCKYSECYNDLVGKYLPGTRLQSSSSTETEKPSTGRTTINKINATSYSQTETIYLSYSQVKSGPYDIEKELSITDDSYGRTYYYRGNVTDNYVNFNNMCWKIVRIEGDGSIKLILADVNGICNASSTTLNNSDGIFIGVSDGYYDNETSTVIDKLNKFLNGEDYVFNNQYDDPEDERNVYIHYNAFDQTKLKTEDWCMENTNKKFDKTTGELLPSDTEVTDWYYETASRLLIENNQGATLKCNGTKYNSKIATLTADEVSFAGYNYKINEQRTNYLSYIMSTNKSIDVWNSMTYSDNSSSFVIYSGNHFFSSQQSRFYLSGLRPSIVLKTGTRITSGDGTIENAYVIE